MLLDEFCACLCLQQIPLTKRPIGKIWRWKNRFDNTYDLFSIFSLPFFAHRVFGNDLHKTMDNQHILIGFAANKRVFEQIFDSSIKCNGICHNCTQKWRQRGSTVNEHFFWNGVGMQKGTELQEFSCCRIQRLDLCERERERCSHGCGMILTRRASSLQE